MECNINNLNIDQVIVTLKNGRRISGDISKLKSPDYIEIIERKEHDLKSKSPNFIHIIDCKDIKKIKKYNVDKDLDLDTLFKEVIRQIEFYNEGTDWCYEETIDTLNELKENIKRSLEQN